MKRVRVTVDMVVEDEQLKTKSDLITEGYEGYEDAIASDGLDAIIDGGYAYNVTCEISDV